MPSINLGKVRPVHQGTYDGATTYNTLDIVSLESGSWICNTDGTVGVTPSNAASQWELLAQGVFVDDNGNVGIGAAPTTAAINVKSSTNTIGNFKGNVDSGFQILGVSATRPTFRPIVNNVSDSSAELAYNDDVGAWEVEGRLMVGSTSETGGKLIVAQNNDSVSGGLQVRSANDIHGLFFYSSNGGERFIQCGSGGTETLTINSGGGQTNVGGNLNAGTTNSTITRFKVGGIGSTAGTYTTFMVNSTGTNVFYVRDDGNAYHSGNVGIGTNAPEGVLDVRGRVDFYGGNNFSTFGSDFDNNSTRTNATIKASRLAMPHYTNTEEPAMLLYSVSDAASTAINIGGGSSIGNAATSLNFYTAANPTTTTGTVALAIDSSQNAEFSGDLTVNGSIYSEDAGVNICRITSSDGLGDAVLRFYSGANYKGGIGWDQATDELGIYSSGNSALPALSLNSSGGAYHSGNVGIGVAPNSAFRTLIKGTTADGTASTIVCQNSGGGSIFYVNNNGNTYIDGNVGIGTTPTGNALQVGGSVGISGITTIGSEIRTNPGSGDSIYRMYVGNVEKGKLAATNTGDVYIESSGAEAVRFDASQNAEFGGNVGIGEAPNSTVLLSAFGAGASNIGMDINLTGTSLANYIRIENDNGIVGSITATGTTTSFNTSSDPRLKDFKALPTDEEINTKFDSLYGSFRVFDWKNGSGADVWGFDAHVCIDAGLDMGAEGRGGRDLEIGEVYDTEEVPEVTETITKQVQKTVTKTRETTTIEVVDGVPTQVVRTEEYEEPVFKEIGVVDEQGQPVTQLVDSGEFEDIVVGQDEDGIDIIEQQPIMVEQQITHSIPVMVEVTETVVTQEAQTIEKTVSPAGVDQSKAVPILLAKIEQLERRLKTLESV